MSRSRVAVVGHVEWVEFVRVERVPTPGEIVPGEPRLSVPAGGGAVAAVQLARWGTESVFFTALGDDALGHRALDELRARGVEVHAAFRPVAQRRAVTFIDAARERTIVTFGARLEPAADDPLPWDDLGTCDAVYVTGCDAGALGPARRARRLVGTSRILPLFRAAGTQLDALVGSAADPDERYAAGDLEPAPGLVVQTEGERGGHYLLPDGAIHRYASLTVPVTGDTYGAGDTFAAGLTLALAEGKGPADALSFAAAHAAEVVGFEGPYPPP